MGRRVLQLPIDDAIVGRGDHLHVLQRAREPIDARLGKHDPERRMTIEHAAEDQLADDLTERHEALQQEGSCAATMQPLDIFADVEAHCYICFLNRLPEGTHGLVRVTGVGSVGIFTRRHREHEGLESEPLQFGDSLPRCDWISLIHKTHAVEEARIFGLNFREMFVRSEEHTSELQSLMRISYAVFCLKKKNKIHNILIKTNYYHLQSRQVQYNNN